MLLVIIVTVGSSCAPVRIDFYIMWLQKQTVKKNTILTTIRYQQIPVQNLLISVMICDMNLNDQNC